MPSRVRYLTLGFQKLREWGEGVGYLSFPPPPPSICCRLPVPTRLVTLPTLPNLPLIGIQDGGETLRDRVIMKASDSRWKILKNLGNLRKMLGNLWEIAKISLILLFTKQRSLIFSCATQYRVEHSEIKFVSTQGHVYSAV